MSVPSHAKQGRRSHRGRASTSQHAPFGPYAKGRSARRAGLRSALSERGVRHREVALGDRHEAGHLRRTQTTTHAVPVDGDVVARQQDVAEAFAVGRREVRPPRRPELQPPIDQLESPAAPPRRCARSTASTRAGSDEASSRTRGQVGWQAPADQPDPRQDLEHVEAVMDRRWPSRPSPRASAIPGRSVRARNRSARSSWRARGPTRPQQGPLPSQ